MHKDNGPDMDGSNGIYLAKERFVHIIKAARSATVANVLAPLLCIPMFRDEVRAPYFDIWLAYMLMAVFIRTVIVYRLEYRAEKIEDPQRCLRQITLAVGLAGSGWGLGWPLLTPDLSMVNRMIYVYMTTAAMIASMFAYSVDKRVFYTFTLPIMVPAMSTVFWPVNIFPWPFAAGLMALYFIVLSIAKNFSVVFTDSVNLRFRNERLFQELADERDQSIAANVAKSKFIAVASHDLRQPLHAVNINLELLRLSELKERDVNLVSRIKNSVTALNNMFEALLNMSKIDAHAGASSESVFSLTELSAQIRGMFELRAAAKGLSFILDAPPLMVKGDKWLLQQLLMNLVANAIQYTERGTVEVRFLTPANGLVVEVIDSGVGISREDQANIFNEFYRAERTRAAHEGLGLGLTIVQRLCKLIQASVSVQSHLGRGAVFTLTTRYAVVNGAGGAAADDGKSQAEPEDTRSLAGKTIAVVEDDGIIADAYQQTLRARAANIVVLSENDDELQQQLASIDHIDCVLSDYRLRSTTGIAIIEKIRESFNSDIPAVIVTGDTSPGNIKDFSGFNALILYKPLTLSRITKAISDAIHGEAARH